MSAARRTLGALKLRHRARAFRGAVGLVTAPGAFVAREAVFYPLRPVSGAVARCRGASPAEGWRSLTGRVGNLATYTLRRGGRRVTIRHGSPDVYLLYETLGRTVYALPPPVRRALDAADGPLRVVDLGANIGLFEVFLARHLAVGEVVAYEPDPDNLRLLRRNVEQDRSGARWRIVEACAAARDGSVAFMSGRFAESRVPEAGAGGPTTEVPARDVFPDLAGADLLKIDIEGGEWEILGDPRFADLPARAVVLEYHAWRCPGPDPRRAALDALRGAGYTLGAPEEDAPGFGVVWAWRAGQPQVS